MDKVFPTMPIFRYDPVLRLKDKVQDSISGHQNETISLLSSYYYYYLLRWEAILPPFVYIAICPRPGVWEYVRVNVFELIVDNLSVAEYLRFKQLVDEQCIDEYVLELDFEPFNATFPRPTRSSSIGNGVQFLNRHPSSIISQNKESLEPLLPFLRTHKYHGQVMMLNDRIGDISKRQSALVKAEELLSELPTNTPYSDFEYELRGLGFERGWGDASQRVSEMVHLLLEILQAPDPSTLETFLGRIPMVFNVVVVSPHGCFGQANVLGYLILVGRLFISLIKCELWNMKCSLESKSRDLTCLQKFSLLQD